tara:strand:+ start:716 stop:859 length:144 start_codon:yes stop_codon:yes gene_type:complete
LTENFQTIEKKEEKLILKQKSGLIINQKNEKDTIIIIAVDVHNYIEN